MFFTRWWRTGYSPQLASKINVLRYEGMVIIYRADMTKCYSQYSGGKLGSSTAVKAIHQI